MITSETRIIKRSQINLNPCNPKRHTSEAIKLQKKNLQDVGFLGGIVWNEKTGNLIDGHRRISAMDLINKYDGSNDYEIKVEVVSMDEKTEKHQLTYMAVGNTKADIDLIAEYANEIDLSNVGLSESDIKDILSLTDKEEENITEGLDDLIQPIQSNEPIKTPEEKKEHVKEVKDKVKSKAEEKILNDEAYIMLSFTDDKAKQAFCELVNTDKEQKFAKGEEVLNLIK